jgi:arylsulfatase
MTVIDKRPNFIVIVADDLGFTDTSAFGGEISTPNIQRLAESGLRFTDFHTASACSPTRSMLLSGTDNHIAGLGQMAEFASRIPEKFRGKPGYEGYLNFKVAALPEILKDAGYFNFIAGKWHLGLSPEHWPTERGFHKSFTLLPGAGNHYKYFPKNEKGDYLNFLAPIFEENGKRLNPEIDIPENFYSSNYFTDKFIDFFNSTERGDKPFFGLLTYTAPHWPYQADEKVIAKYKGVYDHGPDVLRKERLNNAIKLNIIPKGIDPHRVETQREKAWKDLSNEEKQIECKIMEIYAAMVEIMDTNIGRVLDEVEKAGELDNTFILFMSDNGAEGMMMEAMSTTAEQFQFFVKHYYNNNFNNLGKKDSFVWYSDQWAQAATAPYYMYKMWASEGGIRCPLIISHPNLISNEFQGNIKSGFLTVMDILPTVIDLAGVQHPAPNFHGREVVPVKGKSLVSYLKSDTNKVHNEETVTGWELFAQQAIRKGNYKALFIPKPMGPDRWQLFDLNKDPGETTDISESFPDILKELINHWSEYVAETGLVECSDVFYEALKGEYNPKYIN